MKVYISIILLIFIVSGVSAANGKEILQMADEVKSPDTTHGLVELIITESNGSNKNRIVEMWSSTDSDNYSKQIMVFRAPASVKNTRFLVKENEDGDDKWIFMPALGKVRRIAASDGSSSFMGTEFTYDDMSDRDIDDDTHKLLREDEFNGQECYVIESTPVDPTDSEYSKRIKWVIKDSDILETIKIEFYNKKGELSKVLTIPELQYIDGFWIPIELKMENIISGRSSTLLNKKIEINIKTNPGVFEKRFLTTGKVK